MVARIGDAALAAWEQDAIPPDGWQVDPDALRLGWRNLIVRASELGPDETVLIVTSNGIARFLPDVVNSAPDGLDRKLKTGAWGVVELHDDSAHISAWNVRP